MPDGTVYAAKSEPREQEYEIDDQYRKMLDSLKKEQSPPPPGGWVEDAEAAKNEASENVELESGDESSEVFESVGESGEDEESDMEEEESPEPKISTKAAGKKRKRNGSEDDSSDDEELPPKRPKKGGKSLPKPSNAAGEKRKRDDSEDDLDDDDKQPRRKKGGKSLPKGAGEVDEHEYDKDRVGISSIPRYTAGGKVYRPQKYKKMVDGKWHYFARDPNCQCSKGKGYTKQRQRDNHCAAHHCDVDPNKDKKEKREGMIVLTCPGPCKQHKHLPQNGYTRDGQYDRHRRLHHNNEGPFAKERRKQIEKEMQEAEEEDEPDSSKGRKKGKSKLLLSIEEGDEVVEESEHGEEFPGFEWDGDGEDEQPESEESEEE